MECVVRAGDLKENLNFARAFTASKRSATSAARSIRLSALEGREFLVIEAADLTKACRVGVAATEILRRGACVVEGDRLARMVRTHPDEDRLHLTSDRRRLVIRGPRGERGTFATLDPDALPSIPGPPEETAGVKVRKDALLSAVRRVRFAAASNSMHSLFGEAFASTIFFRNGLVFATDRTKLALIEGFEPPIAKLDLPADAEPILQKLGDPIVVYPGSGDLAIKSDDRLLHMRTVPCEAPDALRILSAYDRPTAVYRLGDQALDRLDRALRRTRIVGETATFLFLPDHIYVAGISEDEEHSVVDVVSAERVHGPKNPLVASYSGAYVAGAISGLGEATLVTFGPGGPLEVTAGSYKALIQVVRFAPERAVLDLASQVAT